MSDKKYFVLMENGKDTSQVFASKQPRGAALKAATRGHTNIRLRERGTKRVHVFTGSISMVDKPAGGPAWLPDRGQSEAIGWHPLGLSLRSDVVIFVHNVGPRRS